jgi:hypothetical protein
VRLQLTLSGPDRTLFVPGHRTKKRKDRIGDGKGVKKKGKGKREDDLK